MKRALIILAALGALAIAYATPANALTLMSYPTRRYFVGTTEHLFKIRAALAKVGGYPQISWTPPYDDPWQMVERPWGMGDVDCMHAGAFPGESYDTTTPYLGMSVSLNGETIEIPAYEDLASEQDWPGECYGFQFYKECVADPWFGPLVCADPAP